jgi:protein arginine kinase activator
MEEWAMKCQSCASVATVHLTDIVNGHKTFVHLCQTCAEQRQKAVPQAFNLPAVLQTLIGSQIGPLTDELARLTCPECGIKYMEFRAEGRLGCPHDYEVFRIGLEPLLARIHRGGRHVGKVPRHVGRNDLLQNELLELRRQLQVAVAAEAYEEAARLRDVLRQKEAMDESG